MDSFKTNGFFLNLFQNIRNTLKSEDIKNFTNLQDNEEKFKLVHNLSRIEGKLKLKKYDKDVKLDEYQLYKDLSSAMELKKIGNKMFQGNQWPESLNFYNKSYLMTPADCTQEISIIFANRSASLYHMNEYDLAITEIKRAVQAGYPKDMIYKLNERKARCYLAKKDNEQALKAFQETVQALDDAKIPLEKVQKMERDAQVMIKMLIRNIELDEQLKKKQGKIAEPKEKGDKPKAKKEFKKFVSENLAFDYTTCEGRFAKAGKEIKIGENLVQEKPHVSVLLKEYSQTNCQHCFKRVRIPLACKLCSDVIFCTEDCREIACNSYHKYECGLLPHLWNSGASITCLMALRIITQKSLKYFTDLKESLGKMTGESMNFDEVDNLPNEDYRKVFGLVTHENTRTFEDIFHRTVMSSFLMYVIKLGGFFEEGNENDFNYIGKLVLHNIQFLQFNAHEISELQYREKNSSGISTFIGGGLYPTLALFNHSCDPGVVRFYTGTIVNVRAIRKIPLGQVVAENYGPIFSQVTRDERKKTLQEQYKFDCNCTACLNNWPTFKEMNDNFIRFRCEGLGKTCTNVLMIPIDIKEFIIKCTECGESTNIMKGLKALQDTDMLFKLAKKLHENGELKTAMTKYLEMISIFDENLVPPFRDYNLAQQGVRSCVLEFGNKHHF